jgi:hypothetical protein
MRSNERMRHAFVAAALLVTGCFEHDTAEPRLDARLWLSANLLSDGGVVEIRLGFLQGSEPAPVPLTTQSFPVQAAGPQDFTLTVDLVPCLQGTDVQTGCRITADLLLRDVTNLLLDSVRVGPFDARPGETATSPLATLQAPASIEVETGDGQLGWSGRELLEPVTVRLIDRNGAPMPGRPLHVDVVTGDGVSPEAVTVTDGQGRASVRYTVGATPGAQSFRVSGPAALSATLGVTAVPVLRRTLVAGFGYTCTLDVAGAAECWGDNRPGTLGNPTVVGGSPSVVSVQTAARFVALTASHGNNIYTGAACGLTATGRAFCWGITEPGSYGAPAPDTCYPFSSVPPPAGANVRACSKLPSAVNFGPDLVQIDVGGGMGTRLCGIVANGDAYCVGQGTNGELGNGGTATSMSFELVVGGHKWLQISAGHLHTCGLTTAAEIFCWGRNDHGQLGDGGTTPSPVPIRTASSSPYRFVHAGFERSCGITMTGEVHCWGERDVYSIAGSLGSTPDVLVPTPVPGVPPAVSVEIGIENFCAMTATQEAWCWGYDRGQGSLATGRGYPGTSYVPPARVAVTGAVSELAAGLLHTCVKLVTATISCAGTNIVGQLGLGFNGGAALLSPVPVVRPGVPAGAPASMTALVDTVFWSPTPTSARPAFFDAAGRGFDFMPAVLVTDAAGRGVPGISVIWSPSGAGSTVPSPNTTLTDGSGRALRTGWTLGPTPGTYSLLATVTGLGPQVTFRAGAVTPGPPSALLASASELLGPREFAAPLGDLTTGTSLLLGRVIDGNRFPLAGVPVHVTRSLRATGSTSVPPIPATLTTDALGDIRLTSWQHDTVQVADTILVHLPGVTPSPRVSLVMYSVNPVFAAVVPATAQAGQVAPAIELEVRDRQGNVDVSFTGSITLAGLRAGELTGATLGQVTAVAGRAIFSGVVFPSAGTYQLSAVAAYFDRVAVNYTDLGSVVVTP